MARVIIPVLLLVVSAGLFFGFVDPQYQEIKQLSLESKKYDQALQKSKELQQVRDQLLAKYNSIPPENLSKLEQLLPENIDNVRLILDIDTIARPYGLVIRNLTVSGTGKDAQTIGTDSNVYGSVALGFSVTARYENFIKFMHDLERSLRVVDITSITFTANDSDSSDYQVLLKTYWLK